MSDKPVFGTDLRRPRRVTVYLDEQEYQAVRRLAFEREVKMAGLIRSLLEAELDRRATLRPASVSVGDEEAG